MTIFRILAFVLLFAILPSLRTFAGDAAGIRTADTDCFESILSNCRVLTEGFINLDQGDRDGEPFIAWQTQGGFTPEDGVLGGFVLFHYRSEGWARVDSGFDGYRFDPPRLNEEGLMHIAGYKGGTGARNADRLYQWRDLDGIGLGEGWRPIDMQTWLDTIDEKLPTGLEIWKGVSYQFVDRWSGLVAHSPLWRATDGNCCPTGGSAIITLEIEDDRLVATDVRYLAPH